MTPYTFCNSLPERRTGARGDALPSAYCVSLLFFQDTSVYYSLGFEPCVWYSRVPVYRVSCHAVSPVVSTRRAVITLPPTPSVLAGGATHALRSPGVTR